MTPALHAIGLAAGAALCGLLGLMQLRVDRTTGGPSGYQILWVIGFLWTFGGFLRYTLPLAGVDATAMSVRIADLLAWSCTILGPLAIGRFLQAGIGETSRAARRFLAVHRRSLVAESHSARLGRRHAPCRSLRELVSTDIFLCGAGRDRDRAAGLSRPSRHRCREIIEAPLVRPRRDPACRRPGHGHLAHHAGVLAARCSARRPQPDQRALGHSLVDTGRGLAGPDSLRGPGAQAQSLAARERGSVGTGQRVRFRAIGIGPGAFDTRERVADAERTACSCARRIFVVDRISPGSAGLRGGGQRLRGIGAADLRTGTTLRTCFADGAIHAAPRRQVGSGRRGCGAGSRAGVDSRSNRTAAPAIASRSPPVTRRVR